MKRSDREIDTDAAKIIGKATDTRGLLLERLGRGATKHCHTTKHIGPELERDVSRRCSRGGHGTCRSLDDLTSLAALPQQNAI